MTNLGGLVSLCQLRVQAVVREGDKCTRLFILDQGTLCSRGRMLEAGAVVGVQHFLLSRDRWSRAVTTVTYSRLQSLDKGTFDEYAPITRSFVFD